MQVSCLQQPPTGGVAALASQVCVHEEANQFESGCTRDDIYKSAFVTWKYQCPSEKPDLNGLVITRIVYTLIARL